MDGIVHGTLKTAQRHDWSAPDDFFAGKEKGSIEYTHSNDSFKSALELTGLKHAGPYVLTVDTGDGDTLTGYKCGVWNPWAKILARLS